MCILCDLGKEGREGEEAKFHVEHIIDLCDSIRGGYKAVLSGAIKPHSDAMKALVTNERALVRTIIQDIL